MTALAGHRLLPGLQLSIRAAAAAGLSVIVAEALHLQYPLYAMIGAVIVTELSAADTRRLGLSRLVGTLIGATLGAAFSQFVLVRPVTIATGIVSAMFVMYVIGLPSAARLAGYVCGIVLLAYHDHPWIYAWLRMVETVIGIAAAVIVSLVPMLIRAEHAANVRPSAKAADG